MRTKDVELEREREGEGGGGGGTTRGHTHRHSWDPETAMQLQNSTGRAANKMERSQSVRFDRMDTNNRFDRLNPDTEAPGEAMKSGNPRERKRNSRSASGSSSYRSRSPKRKPVKEGKDHRGSGHGADRGGGRDKESVSVTSTNCELEWDCGSHKEHDNNNVAVESVSKGDEQGQQSSSVSVTSGSGSMEAVEQTSLDKMSGASAQGGDTIQETSSSDTPPDTHSDSMSKMTTGGDVDKTKARLAYSRVS